MQLTEIQVVQGVESSQQHVLNPSALEGMTITTVFLHKSVGLEKHFRKPLHVVKISL